MSYQGSVKFTYTCKDTTNSYSPSFPDIIPDETITVESPCYDLNVYQYFELFKKFVRSIGFSDQLVMMGACNIAFSDANNEEDMRKVASEYELILAEDNQKMIQKYSEEIEKYQQQIEFLEEKLSKYEDQDEDVTSEKVFIRQNGYSDDKMSPWNGLIPGSDLSRALGCMCPVLDNMEMPNDKKWVDAECPIHGRKKND